MYRYDLTTMRILVTGGAGFIGSYFVRALLCGNYTSMANSQVTVLDKITYAGNPTNLEPFYKDPRMSFVRGDITDEDLVEQLVSGVDLVVHFAAESHVDRSILKSSDFIVANVLGTQVLLDAARRHKVARFVYISTDEVYGSIDNDTFTETSPMRPNSPYAASKAAGDHLTYAYHRTHGLDTVITRGTNTYGPYQFPEKLIPLFVTNLMDGNSVPLYGDGQNVRDWLHVDDHCRGIALAIEKGRPGESYNIGAGAEQTNVEVTKLLLAACGAGWNRVRYVADRKGHDRRYALDLTKSAAELGYVSEMDFERGLADTVRWYSEHRAWWEPLKYSKGMEQ